MKIVIGHLFYDLLNLYGENGNVIALEKSLQTQDIEVEIKTYSIHNEPWNLEDVDILYIGAGTEQNQLLALNTLKNYKDEINQMMLDNKLILATGNSIELLANVLRIVINILILLKYLITQQPELKSELFLNVYLIMNN